MLLHSDCYRLTVGRTIHTLSSRDFSKLSLDLAADSGSFSSIRTCASNAADNTGKTTYTCSSLQCTPLVAKRSGVNEIWMPRKNITMEHDICTVYMRSFSCSTACCQMIKQSEEYGVLKCTDMFYLVQPPAFRDATPAVLYAFVMSRFGLGTRSDTKNSTMKRSQVDHVSRGPCGEI